LSDGWFPGWGELAGVSWLLNKGMRSGMRNGNPRIEPVDTPSSHEWEADVASELGAGLIFWCWYLPTDALRPRLRAVLRTLAHGRVMLRYPVYTATVRHVAERVPVRPH
jgi:hypothetical protein